MHVYYVKPISKTQRRRTYIYASEDVLLIMIKLFIIYHFYFQVKSCFCKINLVILLHSVELLILFHQTSLKRKANIEYN